MSRWQTSTFHSFDGLKLFYRFKTPEGPGTNALLFLHRGHEHSGRIVDFADRVSDNNYWCFAFDLRGHGRSQGRRAWAENFDVWVKDLNSFAGHIRQTYGIQVRDTVLVANSVGSVMAVRWILNYGANVKGCILGAPAFSIKLYIPFALPFLRVFKRFSPHLFVSSYVRSGLLTRDRAEAKAYDDDPLITRQIGVNVLVGLFDAANNCFQRLQDFEVPVLLFTAEKDYIVDNRKHSTFLHGISSRIKKQVILKNFRHAVFHEKEQHILTQATQKFLDLLYQQDGKQLPAVMPQAKDHTVREYEQLQSKPTRIKHVYYTLYRQLFHRLGPLSHGIRTGLQSGFDSGLCLDYVYRNQAGGAYLLGPLLDRIYLNAIGWRGIRLRKAHLQQTLLNLSEMMHSRGKTPTILDVASGVGRYLFEVQKQQNFTIYLHLNDLDQNCIAQAQQLQQEMQAEHVSYSNSDVFTLFQQETFSPRPNVIVISGLFELYENNHQIHNVIRRLYTLLDEGGYLVYTGQPWHPQIEMIGRVLNNRHGQAWTMRRRIQSEMDQLVESAGFEKLSTESEYFGIFTVSCAVKPTKTRSPYGPTGSAENRSERIRTRETASHTGRI
ncbi:MAG: bifunctional alpha/beta hydrolase/class I SAM-dependent methyltransferase [Gammaproteobacteria bacterium]|nr:bifunctional alpha/beta hydrolase/class I SAM-dependent methyltransferase [Gammaproteobacteria bacterium]MDH5803158.1 bifunctional alpha/beta hydrolase/class I SAM-dependent methyltransferase [Gammaproteobacteria bacterium]